MRGRPVLPGTLWTPVFWLSADTCALADGFHLYLAKPVTPEDLAAAVSVVAARS
jgi:CheY-like chemotaxis protein